MADYSKYECPYSHLERESGHELHGPEGYQDVYGVWCACGFRAPVFYLDPDEIGLRLKREWVESKAENQSEQCTHNEGRRSDPLGIGFYCERCTSFVRRFPVYEKGRMVKWQDSDFWVVEDNGDYNVLIANTPDLNDPEYNDWWVDKAYVCQLRVNATT